MMHPEENHGRPRTGWRNALAQLPAVGVALLPRFT
jgi:hypothetical protein